MIFYFSGTGNSLYVAKEIAKVQNEELISISKEVNYKEGIYEYNLKEDEKIIFVYPIYAWAPPKKVIEFIGGLKLNNYKANYISTVATCGENIGNTMKLLKKVLEVKELVLNSGFSIVMPNNYMIQGDVESEEGIKRKMGNALESLNEINNTISNKERDIFNVIEGHVPFITTSIVNPLFNKYMINSKKFTVTDDCISCGLCEKVCNNKCIKVDKLPKWESDCSFCLACINYCPKGAIQYGNSTKNKGKYRNPKIKVEEMTF